MKYKKKGGTKTKGQAANYITRAAALKKLQLSLQAFRKMCILKGVYPRDPKKKARGKDKTYYHVKDIKFLEADPLIDTFRSMKSHSKKISKAKAKKQPVKLRKLILARPKYRLDTIIRERYPRFVDVLRDMDDALSMIHIFANHPKTGRVKREIVKTCARLRREWDMYVVKTRCLTKSYVTIKGYYYQVEVMGEQITWMVPHKFTQPVASDVDYRVMMTFLELYNTLLGFTFFRLYQDAGMVYPPTCNEAQLELGNDLAAMLDYTPKGLAERLSAATVPMDDNDDEMSDGEQKISNLDMKAIAEKDSRMMQEASVNVADGEVGPATFAHLALDKNTQNETHMMAAEAGRAKLFSNLHVFVSREVPRHSVEFCLRAFGARVSWPGSSVSEDDKSITHQIVDKDLKPNTVLLGRVYVQPQWVFDSINNAALLPVADYSASATLPPHLSPFVDDEREGYVPAYRAKLDNLLKRAREHRAALEAAGQVAVGTPLSLDEVASLPDSSKKDVNDDMEEDLEAQYERELAAEAAGETFAEHQQKEQKRKRKQVDRSDSSDESQNEEEEPEAKPSKKKRKTLLTEQEKLASVMLPKRHQRLLKRIEYSHNKKQDKVAHLEDKAKKAKKKNKSKNKK